MTTAWTRGIAVGLLAWPLACEVRVTDDLDGVGGVAGSSTGRGGNVGSAGRGGIGGAAGSAGQAGFGGGGLFPTPTCSAEAEDEGDACVQCMKELCCTEWLGCDDQTCFEEWTDVAACMVEYDFAPNEDDYGMCLSDSSAAMDGLVQPNTVTLLDCVNVVVPANDGGADTTRCGTECFGSDVFFFD